MIPCTLEEIIAIEKTFKIKLPQAYQDFLLTMGHSGGDFLKGSDCFYKQLPLLKEWAIELLEENNFTEPLPDDAFVFFMHQGYQFSFFRLSEGDNPPIYFYYEGQKETNFLKTHDYFTDFMATEIELYNQYSLSLVY
jgi:hypothetical protein